MEALQFIAAEGCTNGTRGRTCVDEFPGNDRGYWCYGCVAVEALKKLKVEDGWWSWTSWVALAVRADANGAIL